MDNNDNYFYQKRNKGTDTKKLVLIIAGVIIGTVLVFLSGCFFMMMMDRDKVQDNDRLTACDSVRSEERFVANNGAQDENAEAAEEQQQTMADDEAEEVRRTLAEASYVKYENGRFGYSASYPSCFRMEMESENGDGMRLSMGHGISMNIYGFYNVNERTIRDLFEEDRGNATYSVQRKNWYVVSGFLHDDMIYWKKVVLMNNFEDMEVFVTLNITCPRRLKDAVNSLIEYENKHFTQIGH